MRQQTFNQFTCAPASTPAVLETATWHKEEAIEQLKAGNNLFFQDVGQSIEKAVPLPDHPLIQLHASSATHDRGVSWCLAELKDKQYVLLSVGPQATREFCEPFHQRQLADNQSVLVYEANGEQIDNYIHHFKRDKAPQASGAIPKLGIGCRMSTSVWPAAWRAMSDAGFAANPIQNSVRELNLLDDVLEARPARTNIMFGLGTIAEGHTGSTFEGLWVYGVLSALKSPEHFIYGADADHIMVKRGPRGDARARQVIAAARRYSFFTLDVSDILNYHALSGTPSDAEDFLSAYIPSAHKAAYIHYHQAPWNIGGETIKLDRHEIGLYTGKYNLAFEMVDNLLPCIRQQRQGKPFDLELSIDEIPPDVAVFDAITSERELTFLVREIQRRNCPITHIAPNFGVEKGVDYRAPGGYIELESRVVRLHHIVSEVNMMLDCHSGDDLSSATRKTFGRATNGSIHFKISPSLQALFGETLQGHDPVFFNEWWQDTFDYVSRKAQAGSLVASREIEAYKSRPNASPSAQHSLFRHYCFDTVGRRNDKGEFIFRDRFYTLSHSFYTDYTERLYQHLLKVAADIFHADE